MGRDKVKRKPSAGLSASIADINEIHREGVKIGRLAAYRKVREANHANFPLGGRDFNEGYCTHIKRMDEAIDALIAKESKP